MGLPSQQLDVSEDFLVVDNLESITFYSRLSDGTYAAGIYVPYCLRRAQRHQFQQGGDWVAVVDMNWHIWRDNLPTVIPKAQDKIIAIIDNTSWIIAPVNFDTWVTRYALPCKRLLDT